MQFLSKVFKSAVTVSMGKISGQVSQGYSHDVSQLGSHLRLLFPTQHCQGSVPWSCRIHTGFDFETNWSHFSDALSFFKAPLIRSGPPVYSLLLMERQLIFKQITWYPLIFTGSSYTQRKEAYTEQEHQWVESWKSRERVLPSVITDKCVINKMCIVNRQ